MKWVLLVAAFKACNKLPIQQQRIVVVPPVDIFAKEAFLIMMDYWQD